MSRSSTAAAATDDQVLERAMPHSLEAERSVLGALLITEGAAFLEVADTLRPEDFYRDGHRLIFRSMADVHARKRPIDMLTVRDRLQDRSELDQAGGPAYIARLVDGVPRSTNVEHYAAIVREKAVRRRVMAIAHQLIEDAYDGTLDARDVVDKAEASLIGLSNRELAGETLKPIAMVMEEVSSQVADAIAGKAQVRGIPTTWTDLDAIIGGLKPGLIVVGARSSMGKTTFMMNLVERVCTTVREPGIVFSLEQEGEELGLRAAVCRAGIDGHRVTLGTLTNFEIGRLGQAIDAIGNSALYIDDSPYRTISEIRTLARRVKAKEGLSFICVDYLQLMSGGSDRADKNGRIIREQEVASFSRGLKAIAKELKVPVIALSQILRSADDRPGGRPRISDLRESGAIENDADLVLLLFRPSVYDKTKPKDQAEVIVAKQRNGPTGTLFLRYDQASYRFLDWYDDDKPRAAAHLPFPSES